MTDSSDGNIKQACKCLCVDKFLEWGGGGREGKGGEGKWGGEEGERGEGGQGTGFNSCMTQGADLILPSDFHYSFTLRQLIPSLAGSCPD